MKLGTQDEKKVVGVWDEAIRKTEEEKIEKDRKREAEEAEAKAEAEAAAAEEAPEETPGASGVQETQDVQSEESAPEE